MKLLKKVSTTFRDKCDMYNTIIANMIAKSHVILEEKDLDSKSISIGYNNLESSQYVMKYYVIHSLPMYLTKQWCTKIRRECSGEGIRVDYYIYGEPHRINWDSPEMINKIRTWRNAIENTEHSNSVFDYRKDFTAKKSRESIMQSTLYLNRAELEHKRALCKVSIMMCFVARKDTDTLDLLTDKLKHFKKTCANDEVKVRELKINLLDWMRQLSPFSLRSTKEVNKLLAKRIMTDDVLAQFSAYKQGRLGDTGVPIGIDLYSQVPVLKKFKIDPDAAENYLIYSGTGGGKSYYIKTLLSYLLADDFIITIMDYEGDEYDKYAKYLAQYNPEDVNIIAMGRGSSIYFDPMEIGALTGDQDIDAELKETAVQYILAMFKLLVAGLDRDLTTTEDTILSTAIKMVYEKYGITDDQSTWHLSKGMRIKMIYDELKHLCAIQHFVDGLDLALLKHNTLVNMLDSLRVYFEPGESKAHTFAKPMSVNELYKAKFNVFQFGMRGATNAQINSVGLALKQLCVSNVAIQVSNYCKYVRKCFNVKVWEEYQRWGKIKGSDEIIINAMTGGRKRGDVNFLVTNDLAALLDDTNRVASTLANNFTGMFIGGILDENLRTEFCRRFKLPELSPQLDKIAQANAIKNVALAKKKNPTALKYRHAFCAIMDGEKVIVKVQSPPAIAQSEIFRTGIVQ